MFGISPAILTFCIMRKVLDVVKACQIRAGRAMLSWSQQQLADKADLSRDTIKALETPGVRTYTATTEAVIRVLENEGLRFLEDDHSFGVALDAKSSHAG